MTKFQFSSYSALKTNFESLKNEELKKYKLETVQDLPFDRKEQLETLMSIIDQADRLTISDNQKAQILTGALLKIKANIANSYTGAWKFVSTPANSTVYKGIDAVIGISENNKLDEESNTIALNAYKQYIWSLGQFTLANNASINATARLNHDLKLAQSLSTANATPFYLRPTYTEVKQDSLRRTDIEDMRHYIHMNSEMKKMYKLAGMLENVIKDQDLLGTAINHSLELNREVKDFKRGLLTKTETREKEHDLFMGQDIADPKHFANKDLAEHQASEKKRLFKQFGHEIRMFHPRRMKHVETNEHVAQDLNTVKMK